MNDAAWIGEFPAAITVCDPEGILLGMNEKACDTFAKDGGSALIGTNVLDCHPEPARTKLAALLASGVPNIYSIEKAGSRKLIYQSPWYKDGRYSGFIELALPIPESIPHFIRDTQSGE